MGLFGTKKTDAALTETSNEVTTVAQIATAAMPHDIASAIVKPRITEKAALLLEKNVYTFEVRKGASKHDVRDAIKSLYNVTPVQIRIVNREPRHYMSKLRGRMTMEHGLRKAYVYLKKDDRIDLA